MFNAIRSTHPGFRFTSSILLVVLLASILLPAESAQAGLFGRKKDKADDEPEATTATPSSSPAAAGQYQGPKKSIAVTKFDSSVQLGWGWDHGEALTAMLTESLVNTNRFIVVERAAISDVLQEQDLGASGRVATQGAAKIGKLVGANILVRGTITQFEPAQSGGGGSVRIPIKGFSVGVGGKKQTALVKINLRLMDSTTGQIISTHSAEGKAVSRGVSLDVYHKIDFSANTFKQTPLGQACEDAVNKAVAHIIENTKQMPFYARVASVANGKVYINAGSNRNMKVGMMLHSYARTQEIIDPDTGMVLDFVEEKVGSVTIQTVKEKISIAVIHPGGRGIKIGDMLRLD